MKRISLLIAILFAAFYVNAKSSSSGTEFLSSLHKQVHSKQFATKSLPQLFGGSSTTALSSEKLSTVAREISVSDEAYFQKTMKDVFFPLEDSLRSSKLKESLFTQETKDFSFNESRKKSKREIEAIEQYHWNISSQKIDFLTFINSFSKYIGGFAKIEFTEVEPYSNFTPISQRDPITFEPRQFVTKVRFKIGGLDKAGARREDRLEAQMTTQWDGASNAWKVSSFVLNKAETLVAKKASFQEVKQVADNNPSVYLRREAIRRGGYAMSSCDFDGDGKMDMIVGQLESVEFYKGLGQSKFKRINPSNLGVENETLVKSIVCNDFDNDGLKDLLLVRFAPSEQKGRDIVLYHNENGRFVKKTEIKNRYATYYAMPAAVADFDGDGLLDFYVGFPGAKDFTVLNRSESGFKDKKEFHPQGLFKNLGGFKFEEIAKEKIPYISGYPETAVIFPHTSTAIDYDLDGNMDIVVVDDKANLSPLYRNLGNGQFIQIADKIGMTNYDFGMGFEGADLDNDGRLEFVYTNVNFLPMERLHNSLVNNFSDYSALPGTYGLRLFKSLDGKSYSDITAISGLTDPGYGLGGVALFDYNNDGYVDIYVTNGVWTGNTRHDDVDSLFSRSYVLNPQDYQEIVNSPIGIEQANSSFMKILTDFRGNPEANVKDERIHPSMAGNQRNRMYRNNKDGTFTEVGYLLGVDSKADGYVVSVADVNADGMQDLVLRNADPGTDLNRFPSVQIFENQGNYKNSFLDITLAGKKSNLDAIGTTVEVTAGGKKLTRHLVANNGASQSANYLHFGLGSAKVAEVVKIRWPSGHVDVHRNVRAGKQHFVESPQKTVSSIGNDL